MCVSEELNQPIEGLGELGLFRAVEWPLMEEGQEGSLHHDDMVQDFVQVLITHRFRMGLYRFQQGLICPHLVANKGTKQIDRCAIHGQKDSTGRHCRRFLGLDGCSALPTHCLRRKERSRISSFARQAWRSL